MNDRPYTVKDANSTEKRMLSPQDVATRLGKSKGWFYSNRKRLESLRFPHKDPVLRGWDSNAIDIWIDMRSGLTTKSSVEQKALEAIHGADNVTIR